MIHPLIRALFKLDIARSCRSCREAISYGDLFGASEGVCAGCRS